MSPVILRKPKRPKAKMTDLTGRDLFLLGQAYALPNDTWMCFGTSYFRLEELGLVSDNQITHAGRTLLYERQEEAQRKNSRA